MKYILLLMLWGTFSESNDMALTSQEFNTKEACEVAALESNKQFGGVTVKVYHVCTPKGE